MKKFVLELTKGSQHLGSWYVGDEPLHMRIIDENEVVLELALRSSPARHRIQKIPLE